MKNCVLARGQMERIMKPLLLRLAARYLLVERRRGRALDQVGGPPWPAHAADTDDGMRSRV